MDSKQLSEKIPVAVLGATGAVGQRFIQLLADHPWFKVSAITGSSRSAGGVYGDVCRWVLDQDPPEGVREMTVKPTEANLDARIVFSALPSGVAREVEPEFAKAGYVVCSNASAYREEPGVPLMIPEVNGDHLAMIDGQRAAKGWSGLMVTSPNCTATGLVMTLKPLDVAFGVKKVFVTTLQAVSGAGYPGVPFLDIHGNLIPWIGGEEEKIQSETCLMLGKMEGNERFPAEIGVSVQVTRVPVFDGHSLSIAVEFERAPSVDEAIQVLDVYRGYEGARDLPSSPERVVVVRREQDRPQPRRDRDAEKGMAVSVGRIRECPILDLRMFSVAHNTLRGAASGSIMNAELLVAKGYVD